MNQSDKREEKGKVWSIRSLLCHLVKGIFKVLIAGFFFLTTRKRKLFTVEVFLQLFGEI
jgi:hypothetical protein